jgi:hypothetical protein
MKNKTNQLTLIYIIIALFLAIVFQMSLKYFLVNGLPFYNFSKTLFVFFTGITFISIHNDKRNKVIFEKLKKNNMTKSKSNENMIL